MSWRAYALQEMAYSRFDWMPTLEDARESARKEDPQEAEVLRIEFESALDTARGAGWNGSFEDAPRIFSIPERDNLRFGFIWTQPKTDKTAKLAFVISPIDLPWLGEPDAVLD